ncbi:hypothetical protein SDC9_106748 [bioreactor metagenome]|uniref:Uncharacterized protein n=1 Tax=bioreactor metagenome TaxID=1076179 RepID=A0A645B380_9ZZZZ
MKIYFNKAVMGNYLLHSVIFAAVVDYNNFEIPVMQREERTDILNYSIALIV